MKNIKLKNVENILLVTVNRPEKLNALNTQVIDELSSIFIDYRDGEWPPVTIVNWWGSWCSICMEEFPTFRKWGSGVLKQ